MEVSLCCSLKGILEWSISFSTDTWKYMCEVCSWTLCFEDFLPIANVLKT